MMEGCLAWGQRRFENGGHGRTCGVRFLNPPPSRAAKENEVKVVFRLDAPLAKPDGLAIKSLDGWRLKSEFGDWYFRFENESQTATFIRGKKGFTSLSSPAPHVKK